MGEVPKITIFLPEMAYFGLKRRFRSNLGQKISKKSIFGRKIDFRPPEKVKNEGRVAKTTIFLMQSVYFGPKHHHTTNSGLKI